MKHLDRDDLDPETQRTVAKLERALAENPEQPDLYTELGEAYFAAGQIEQAIGAWLKAYGKYASAFVDERATAGFISCHLRQMDDRGDFQRAVQVYRDAFLPKLAPAHPEYPLFITTFFALGLFERACFRFSGLEAERAKAETYLRTHTTPVHGHFLLGVCHAFLGEFDEALARFTACRESATDLQAFEYRIDGVIAFTRSIAELQQRLLAGDSAEDWRAPDPRAVRQMRYKPPFERLVEFGLKEEDARAWVACGFDSSTALDWLRHGFSPEEARGYRSADVPLDLAIALREAGEPPATGVALRGAKGIAEWREHGFAVSDALLWAQAGLSPAMAASWRSAGFDFETAGRWFLNGFDAPTARSWAAAGWTPLAAARWRPLMLDPEQARAFRTAQFTPRNALPWRRRGFAPDEAAQWRGSGFSAAEAERWRAEGIGPDEAAAFVRRGLDPAGVRAVRTATGQRD